MADVRVKRRRAVDPDVEWRRERDLNPRGGSTPPTRLAGEHFRPLSHPSSDGPVYATRGTGPQGSGDRGGDGAAEDVGQNLVTVVARVDPVGEVVGPDDTAPFHQHQVRVAGR